MYLPWQILCEFKKLLTWIVDSTRSGLEAKRSPPGEHIIDHVRLTSWKGERHMAYKLEGSLLEVCNCEVLCPCWIGVDPDNGTCDSALAHHISKGEIDGVDVSGLTPAFIVHIPGNVLTGNWRAVVHVDERATKQQEEALLSVYTGKQGGPIADLVQLIGEVVAVER